jgi:hypothetical protein
MVVGCCVLGNHPGYLLKAGRVRGYKKGRSSFWSSFAVVAIILIQLLKNTLFASAINQNS